MADYLQGKLRNAQHSMTIPDQNQTRSNIDPFSQKSKVIVIKLSFNRSFSILVNLDSNPYKTQNFSDFNIHNRNQFSDTWNSAHHQTKTNTVSPQHSHCLNTSNNIKAYLEN